MGNAVSEPVLQRHLVLLSEFAGDQKVDQDNQVWRQLFALSVPLSQLPPSQVEQHVTGCCDQLGMTVIIFFALYLTHTFVQYALTQVGCVHYSQQQRTYAELSNIIAQDTGFDCWQSEE